MSIDQRVDDLKSKARELLSEKGYVVESLFEGDCETWIGVYARPRNRPTYLDASDLEEAAEQEKFSINGCNQDFSEWFEWKIVGKDIVDLD